MRRLAVLVVALALVLPSGIVVARVTDADIARLQAEIDALNVRVSALEGATPAPSPTPSPTATPTPTATAAPTPTPTPIPSATPPLTGWTALIRDDFDTLDTSKYGGYPSPWGDSRYQSGDHVNGGVYTGLDSLSVSGGILTIRLYRDATNQPRSAAFIPLFPGGGVDQLYGRYEVRFRVSLPATGWKTAWLLWPASGQWPRDGEIDFPEGNLTGLIEAYMHHQGATTGGDQDAFLTGRTFTDWHTAVTEWTPTAVRFYLDGVLIGTSTTRIPNTPMHWVIQSETALDGSIPAAEAAIQVDYLAAWAYTP